MAACVLVAMALALAACGGGDSSGDPNSINYNPAETTLKDAGLEVCSEADDQIPAVGPGSGPGVTNARYFYVAKNCMGSDTSPNAVSVFQFDSLQTVDAGYAKIKAAHPNGSALKYGPLVLVTTGPDRAQNLSAIETALNKEYPTTSS
jgi:hypothetical protein